MKWFERHLNWTLVLPHTLFYLLYIMVGGDYRSFVISLYLTSGTGALLLFCLFVLVIIAASFYTTGWYLRKKNRSLANIYWFFVPFGWILLLCLKNLSDKQTLPVAHTVERKTESPTIESREKEYEHNVWEIYRKEFATANPEKQLELNKRMLRWQELRKKGLTAVQAYMKAMQEESDKRVVEEPSDKRLAVSSSPRMRRAPLVFLGLALAGAIIYGFVITGDRNAINKDRNSLNTKLQFAQSRLVVTEANLSSITEALSTARTELDSAERKLESTKEILSYVQEQLKLYYETLRGMEITLLPSKECADVVLVDNPKAKNPTLSQLMDFLYQDRTEYHPYRLGLYDCSQFSRDVHNNAEAQGIRAAEVQISFRSEDVGHALNAFLTTDYGLVYVDCTGPPDCIARVRTGYEYRCIELNRVAWAYVRSDPWWESMVTYASRRLTLVSRIYIYW